MLRTVADQPTLWEGARLTDHAGSPSSWAWWTPCWTTRSSSHSFVPFFDLCIGWPLQHRWKTYLRLMFLKFRHCSGFESLCWEASGLDHPGWDFRWIGIHQPVPHPSTLLQPTTRCGSVAADGSTEALLAKAAEAELSAPHRGPGRHHGGAVGRLGIRLTGTVVKAVNRIAATGRRIQTRRWRGRHQAPRPVPCRRASGT